MPENIQIQLKPASVIVIEQQLSVDLDITKIEEKDNRFKTVILLPATNNNIFVFINGTNGEGVDIFYGLCGTTDSNESLPILLLDQRTREAKDLTENYLKDLLSKLDDKVPRAASAWMKIKLISSCLSRLGKRRFKVPKYCGVYYRNNRVQYTGSLRNHPCVGILIDLGGRCTKKILESFLDNAAAVTAVKKRIMKQQRLFQNRSEFDEFLQKLNVFVNIETLKEYFLYLEFDFKEESNVTQLSVSTQDSDEENGDE